MRHGPRGAGSFVGRRIARGLASRAHACAGTHRHRARERRCAAGAARRAARGGRGNEDADARDHRHGRCGQELAHRRDRAPLPARPARCVAHRDRVHRPVAPQVRRRAARRPHPHERDRAPEHLHALARDEGHRQRSQQGAAGRHRCVQGRGIRPRDRRDLGHRAGQCRDRAAGRHVALRDDARVRRGKPAREDRHARLRRLRRDQQVRPQGRAGRAARRAQAVPAQPRGVEDAGRRDAGVRHDRCALQRRRRHRTLPGDRCESRGEGARACEGNARDRRRPAIVVADRDRAGGARALSRGHRGDGAQVSRVGGRPGAHRARAPAAAFGESDARQGSAGPRCAACGTRREARCARPEAPRHVAADEGGVRRATSTS